MILSVYSRIVSIARGVLLLAAFAGCAPDDVRLLLAAASPSGAAEEIARAFGERTGVPVRVSTGASNAVASQVLAGAPADVFLSANPRWADAVPARERRALLRNRLVLVVPRGNPAGVASPSDLPALRRVALAGENVPAGLYAERALRAAGVYGGLRIARGADVRLTLAFVETGEAEAGVVYATDARASGRVEVVHTFPVAVEYRLVLLRPAGRPLYEFLASEEALAVFERHGFKRADP